jgi:L-amino acid N-acyltransferase YncA
VKTDSGFEFSIRGAREADLPVVTAIYNSSIPGRMATADLQAVSVKSLKKWYQAHSKIRPIWLATVVDVNKEEKVVGWLSFQNFYGRPAYAATAEISIYIDETAQRRGLAKKLLEEAIVQAPGFSLETLLAFIFAHNQASLGLFQHFGFTRWGLLPKVAELDGVKRDLTIYGLSLLR